MHVCVCVCVCAHACTRTHTHTQCLDIFPGREPPRIEIYPESTSVITTGSSALFQCRIIGGIPSPTVVWSRYDQFLFIS